MKKIIATAITAVMTCVLLAGCGSTAAEAPAASSAAPSAAASTAVSTAASSAASAESTAASTAASTEATATATAASASDDAAAGDAMYDGKVTIGQSSWIGFAPLYLADKKGFFDKYGADVDVQSFESKTDSKSALAAGKIQGMSTTIDTFVMSEASGMDLDVVLALDTSDGGDGLSAKSDIKDLKSLKGHTVALDTTGGASYFWFQYLLKQQGMTLDDVQAVNMSSGDAGAAFVAGEVDAAVTWEPWLSKAKQAKNGSVLVDSSSTPGVIVDTFAMDRKFAEQYPGTVKAIVQGWYDAIDYIKTNPDDAYKVMMEFTGDETADALKSSMSGVSFYDKDGNKKYFAGDIQKIANMAGDLWVENKLIDKKPDIDSMISDAYLDGMTK